MIERANVNHSFTISLFSMLSEVLVFICVFVAIPFVVFLGDTSLLRVLPAWIHAPWYQFPWDIFTIAFMLLGVILTLGFLIARAYCRHRLGYSKVKWNRMANAAIVVVIVVWAIMFVPCMRLARTDIDASKACFSRLDVRATMMLLLVFMYAGQLTWFVNDLDEDMDKDKDKKEEKQPVGPRPTGCSS